RPKDLVNLLVRRCGIYRRASPRDKRIALRLLFCCRKHRISAVFLRCRSILSIVLIVPGFVGRSERTPERRTGRQYALFELKVPLRGSPVSLDLFRVRTRYDLSILFYLEVNSACLTMHGQPGRGHCRPASAFEAVQPIAYSLGIESVPALRVGTELVVP